MNDDDDDAWLEGAFLAQEEYDQDKDKWKGRKAEMESHFLSQYDVVPVSNEYRSVSSSSISKTSARSQNSNGVVIIALVILGVMFFCLFLFAIALLSHT